jgi:uncharacterized protein YdeI (YjbR/CyaY-like superfamily)
MEPRAMITDPEVFFRDGCGRCDRFATPDCSARLWAAALAALRRICREAGLLETAKWGHPCYLHAGRNIAILGAFRGDVRLTFFNASLLQDKHSLLTRQGANTRHPDCARFTDAAEVARQAPALRDLLAEAKAHAKAGTKPPKESQALELPAELVAALDADPALAAAFHALTPGRQKSHALAIGAAKASATRAARVTKLAPLILAGKGALDR